MESNLTAPTSEDRIGSRLLATGKISTPDLDKALAFQQEMAGSNVSAGLRTPSNRLGAVLVRMGAISEDALLPHLSEQTEMGLLASNELPNSAALNEAIDMLGLTRHWWQSKEAVPFLSGNGIVVAAKDPLRSLWHR